MPAVPLPQSLPTIAERCATEGVAVPVSRFAFWDNFEQRPTRWIADWDGRQGLAAEYRNWLRFVTGDFTDPWLDACRLVLLVDLGGWPAADTAHNPQSFIAPSIDVSCEFHRVGSDAEWLLLDGVSHHAGDGLVASHQCVWHTDGRLAASGISHLLSRPIG